MKTSNSTRTLSNLRVGKQKQENPLAGLTVTGDGMEAQPATADPYAGMTEAQKQTYMLESILYYAQQNAPTTLSPQTKGTYYLLAYFGTALLGLHKFYIGKCLQGFLICLFSVLLGAISSWVLLPLVAVVLFVWVLIETYLDWTGKKPLRDAYGRPLR